MSIGGEHLPGHRADSGRFVEHRHGAHGPNQASFPVVYRSIGERPAEASSPPTAPTALDQGSGSSTPRSTFSYGSVGFRSASMSA